MLMHCRVAQLVGSTIGLLIMCLAVQAQAVVTEEEWGLRGQWGLDKPARFAPGHPPPAIGAALSYNQLYAYRAMGEKQDRYARVGLLLQTYDFRNPVLGHGLGLTLAYEPVLLNYRRFSLAVALSAGMAYITRHYNAQSNPENRAIGSALNGLTGLGLTARYTVHPQWRLLAGAEYKHMSNAGVRLPNEGLNVPALTVGLARVVGKSTAALMQRCSIYTDDEIAVAEAYQRRWQVRLVVLGSVRILNVTAQDSAQAYPIYGFNAVAGYRVWRNHFLSAGLEGLDDRSFREQLRRWTGRYQPYHQLTVLAGYEFWASRIGFTIHHGWNIIRPPGYKPASYQKYGLLYKTPAGWTGGVAVKAYGEDTKNIQLLLGYTFGHGRVVRR